MNDQLSENGARQVQPFDGRNSTQASPRPARLGFNLMIDGDMMNNAGAQSRPVVSLTVGPRTDGDREILQRALSDLAQQDASIRIRTEIEGPFMIAGVSESQLHSIRERILREYGVDADIDRPKAIYLATIRKQAEARGEFRYVNVKLRLEPLEAGSGYEFINEITDEALPPNYIDPINSAIQDVMEAGILGGYEIVDLRAVLCDGSYPRDGSTESAAKIAASMAFKECVRRANPVVLEPIMAIEIEGEGHLNTFDIIGELKSRRGSITGLERYDNSFLLRAIVPMEEMLGYSSFLRSNLQGHAKHSIRLIRYADAFPRSEPGDDETGVSAVDPNDPKPESGGDVAGVPALKPKGPKGKSSSAAVEFGAESD